MKSTFDSRFHQAWTLTWIELILSTNHQAVIKTLILGQLFWFLLFSIILCQQELQYAGRCAQRLIDNTATFSWYLMNSYNLQSVPKTFEWSAKNSRIYFWNRKISEKAWIPLIWREKLQSCDHIVRAHNLVKESIDERCQSHDEHRQDVNKPGEKFGSDAHISKIVGCFNFKQCAFCETVFRRGILRLLGSTPLKSFFLFLQFPVK